LNDNGFNTLLTDGSWSNVKAARMEGLNSYYGNAVSEHADRHLDLVGLGHLLAMAPQKDSNALAAQRYRSEFGGHHVYLLSTEAEKEKPKDDTASRVVMNHDHPLLFSQDVSFSKLASLISQGAKTKRTNISDSFSYADYKKQYGKRAIPLFAFNDKKQLRFFTNLNELTPESGWTVIALIQEDKVETAS